MFHQWYQGWAQWAESRFHSLNSPWGGSGRNVTVATALNLLGIMKMVCLSVGVCMHSGAGTWCALLWDDVTGTYAHVWKTKGALESFLIWLTVAPLWTNLYDTRRFPDSWFTTMCEWYAQYILLWYSIFVFFPTVESNDFSYCNHLIQFGVMKSATWRWSCIKTSPACHSKYSGEFQQVRMGFSANTIRTRPEIFSEYYSPLRTALVLVLAEEVW